VGAASARSAGAPRSLVVNADETPGARLVEDAMTLTPAAVQWGGPIRRRPSEAVGRSIAGPAWDHTLRNGERPARS
jgi:hypothetical protein